jgi:hypothetical protein
MAALTVEDGSSEAGAAGIAAPAAAAVEKKSSKKKKGQPEVRDHLVLMLGRHKMRDWRVLPSTNPAPAQSCTCG